MCSPSPELREEEIELGKTWRKVFEVLGRGAGLPFLCVLLLAGVKGGPDYTEYLAWAKAFAAGRINEIPGEQGSVTGLPLLIAGHGTGLVFAAAELVRRFVPAIDFRFTGWLAAVLTWFALLDAIRRVSGSRRTAVFVCSALFLGTPLGFYSVYAASETISHALVAWLVWWVISKRDWRSLDWLAVGCLSGLLISVRASQGIYAVMALACGAWRSIESRRRNRMMAVRPLLLSLIPLGISVFQLLLVNGWMTGSAFRSPYYFGDGGFRSIDMANAALAAFLLHPWHGLFVYHPLFAVGFVVLLVLAWKGSDTSVRSAALLGFLIIFVHVSGQASWYCWWLGEGTYGSRAMGPAAILLGVALGRFLGQTRNDDAIRNAMRAAMLLACGWSATLLWQEHTNFRTWGELWTAQAAFSARPAFAVSAGFLSLLCVALRLCGNASDTFVKCCSVTTAALSGMFVAWNASDRIAEQLAQAEGSRTCVWLISGVCAMLAAVWAWLDGMPGSAPRPWVFHGAAGTAVVMFLFCTWAFARLALDAERIARGIVPQPRRFAYLCATDLEEARETLMEYEKVPGFEARKVALRSFIEREEQACRLASWNP